MAERSSRLGTFLERASDPISRRYFISNGFDGTLTAIGVVIGAFLSGIPEGVTVAKIGVGATIGLGTSGAWSVWEIERAEKRIERQELEDAMLRDLGDTRVESEQDAARLANATMSVLGPVLGSVLPLTPFLLEGIAFTMAQATAAAVVVGVALLFTFGAYLGSISKQRWFVAGARMGVAGLVVAMLNFVLPG
ncbi:VIT1/CCC1 transporter family protein [Haloprofundus salilacus]|uniref:VIT1/CCC1 transporter family protein n=1 Tax=Haloprofundus salilacus TaxID=2876190 RepID=UPI001CCB9722|nr:VIT1/CCC1 transporter family protein [Haloprofundus salilacus]